MNVHTDIAVTRAEVEDFFYHEAALLDEWKLDEWEKLLADDATYYVPPNDDLDGDYRSTLYIISDDRERIRQRIIRVKDPNCHAEYPKSRTCRLITNVRITGVEGDIVSASANFVVYRYRRHQREFVYVGTLPVQAAQERRQLPHQGTARAAARARAGAIGQRQLYPLGNSEYEAGPQQGSAYISVWPSSIAAAMASRIRNKGAARRCPAARVPIVPDMLMLTARTRPDERFRGAPSATTPGCQAATQ